MQCACQCHTLRRCRSWIFILSFIKKMLILLKYLQWFEDNWQKTNTWYWSGDRLSVLHNYYNGKYYLLHSSQNSNTPLSVYRHHHKHGLNTKSTDTLAAQLFGLGHTCQNSSFCTSTCWCTASKISSYASANKLLPSLTSTIITAKRTWSARNKSIPNGSARANTRNDSNITTEVKVCFVYT